MGAIALAGGLLLAGCGLPSLSRVPAASPSPAHVSLGAPTPGVGNSPVPISSQAPTVQCGNATASLRPAGPLPAPGSFPSGTFMRTITDRGRLVVGISQDTLPFGYLNPLSNQLEGFDIDLAKQVAKAIFGDADHIEYRVTAQSQRVWTLRDGTVDLVARTFEMTCDRWKQVDFSTAYFDASQRLMVSKTSNVQSIRDLAGRRVCAAYGSVSLDNVLDSPSPRPIAVAGRDWTDCLALFQQGQVEAISSDDSILMGLAAQDQSVKVVGPKITDLPYGLGVSQAHPEFVRFVNAVLEKIRSDGTWASLHSRWLNRFGLSATPPVAVYRD
jgi:polar amino acid transport system substrate-binding protein